MRMLYQIQIPRRQKIALMGVFAVGGFVVITGMVRLNFLKVAQNTPDPSCKHIFTSPLKRHKLMCSPDNNYGGAVWSSIECNIGVVCASLPMFKALIDRFFPTLMGYKGNPRRPPPLDGSATGKRSHMQKIDQSEFELEHGTGWKDSYTSHYGGESSHGYSATAEAKPTFHTISSEEHLRGAEARNTTNGGIWKSTSMVVRHGDVQ